MLKTIAGLLMLTAALLTLSGCPSKGGGGYDAPHFSQH